jgi:predicted nuclease of predicted toxin-antitoxin system
LKFLLDVNVGLTIAKALISAGHDVVRAASIDPRAEDQDVLALAFAQGRILVTYDRDFGELVFARSRELPPAVVYIRYEPQDVSDTVARLLPLLDFNLLKGHMTVIDARRTRSTPFPAGSNDND